MFIGLSAIMRANINHAPIDRGRNQIRLIRLFSGSSNDPIRCTSYTVSLNDDPKYQALSYVWGNPKITGVIELNGYDVSVTTNLRSALWHLRLPNECRTMWIDALCINQQDDVEKAWQVNLMGQIYKQCEEVLLWTGEYSEESDAWCMVEHKNCYACVEECDLKGDDAENEEIHCQGDGGNDINAIQPGHLELTTKVSHPDCQWHGRRPRISTFYRLVQLLGDDCHLHHIPELQKVVSSIKDCSFESIESILALGAFLKRSWWSRIWTVQEAILPPVATLYCGQQRLSLNDMARAAERLYVHSKTCCSSFFTRLAQRLEDLSYGEATINIFFNFQRHFAALKLTRGHVPGASLMDYLYVFHERQAKNPRDKIFALLGLLPTGLVDFVDYKVNLAQLYEDMSLSMLERCPDRTLSILWRESEPNGPSPSWAKDFSNETTVFNRRVRSMHYQAGGRRQIQLQKNEDALSILGTRVDVVCATSSSCHTASTYSNHEFAQIKEWADFLRLHSRLDGQYKHGGTVVEAFTRALTGDAMMLDLSYPCFKKDDMESFMQSILGCEIDDGLVNTSLAEELNTSAAGRKLFITKQGSIGLGPSWMKPGDEVWVLFGGSVPFILRASKSDGEGRTDCRHHKVIGDCYVQGIMFGEVLNGLAGEHFVLLG